jgi:hypothetical protein
MDKYELLLALNDLLRTPKEEEKYLQRFAQSAKCQVRRKHRTIERKDSWAGGEPVLVNGAVSLDDHAILAERERKPAHGEK